MRDINLIVVHCAATAPGWMEGKTAKAKVTEIDRWHKDRGWRGFGYHLLIDRDGKTALGRDLPEAGAHTRGHNANSVAVVLVGGRGASATDDFSDHFTDAQDRALRVVLADWRRKFPGARVAGHNEFSAKGCPGFQVGPWLDRAPPMTAPEEKPAPWWAGIVALIRGMFEGKS